MMGLQAMPAANARAAARSPFVKLEAAQSRYHAAVSRYQAAEENCPHWDYESDGRGLACCVELAAAGAAKKKALKAYRAALAKAGAKS